MADLVKEGSVRVLIERVRELGHNEHQYRTHFGTLVHLVVMMGTVEMLRELIWEGGFDVNAQSSDGSTPLHIAAKLGRHECLEALLEAREQVDDTLRDNEGRTAVEVAKNKRISSILECTALSLAVVDNRNVFTSTTTKLMHSLARGGDCSGLVTLFTNPRVRVCVDINALNPHGDSVLHMAARADNRELVVAALDLGADPFMKNKKGRIAGELAKSEPVKAVLREAPMVQNREVSVELGRTEGVLSKWTNYAEGYRRRWFVLEEGTLSYYKSQSEYPVSCRGSINIEFIRIVPHQTDKCRFEIVGTSNASVRYHLRADNVAEAKRWIVSVNHCKNVLRESVPPPSLVPAIPPMLAAINQQRPDLDRTLKGSIQEALVQLQSQESTWLSLYDTLLSRSEHDATLRQTTDEFYRAFMGANGVIRDALFHCGAREAEWQESLDAAVSDKQILEESLRELALENTQLESWVKHRKQQGQNKSKEAFEDEFYDVIDESLHEGSPSASEASTPTTPSASRQSSTRTPHAVALPSSFLRHDLKGYEALHATGFRSTLPADTGKMPPVSLWGILKGALGKDLFRFPIPVNFCEPISMLQRICEGMEHAALLNTAAACSDPLVRIQYIAAFVVSEYASTDGRIGKPFNPLLGETFEYVSAVDDYRYISEQVSHHPPVSASFCESPRFAYYAEVRVRSKFWGKSMELTPEGLCHLHIGAEHYSWKKVATSIHNIIVGKLWLDHHGTVTITCHSTGLRCTVEFHRTGWRASHAKKISGSICDCDGNELYKLAGSWNSHVDSLNVCSGDIIRIWQRHAPLPAASKMYHFSAFTMTLNELDEHLRRAICPTDSRLRPDQRAMEEGDFCGANAEKCRLEEHQRTIRRLLQGSDVNYEPRWFRPATDQDTGEPYWQYIGGYWESRRAGCWEGVPDLFPTHANS